ncbi:MAG TPA: 1-phosphofructokinase family hexose kinase [Methylocella sp.]|nr:1-phosphofructokinase family hexose kinase [Methylocella sp.]
MGTIATLTMNPALDINAATDCIIPGEKLRCTAPLYHPGGGGINVARAVRLLGGDAIAVFPLGGPTGVKVEQLLKEEKIDYRPLAIAGSTRESFTVDERQTGQQFRFVLAGPALTEIEQERCLDRISSLEPRPAYIVGSGSLPPGVPLDFYARLAKRAKRLGARLIVDTSGEALRQAGRGGIYLLKPSLRELQELVGREINGERQQEIAARELIKEARSEIVVLSLGAAGALLATADKFQRFGPIEVPVRSTVGAGDSMVAGIVLSLVRGRSIEESVCFGMAAGAAASMRPGTELCTRQDTERLFAQIWRPFTLCAG